GVHLTTLDRRIRKAIAGTETRVYRGNARGSLEFLEAARARTTLISVAGVFGGTSLVVAIFVVVGTFALTIQQRHREIALLRAVAATPSQVRAIIGREALLLGTLGSLVGASVSVRLADWIRERLVAAHAIPRDLELTHSSIPVIGAVV